MTGEMPRTWMSIFKGMPFCPCSNTTLRPIYNSKNRKV
jgi:hypothetical protein